MNNELQYREAYNQGKPIVPDDVYDEMFGTTETTLDDNNVGTLVPHLHPMLSLPTYFEDINNLTAQRLQELLGSNKLNSNSTISYKLDGISVSAIYDASSSKLLRLVSRGKRTSGYVLNPIWNFVFVEPEIPVHEGIYDFRGELVISKASFERINNSLPVEQRYANARSMVAANVNSLTPNPDVVEAAVLFMHGIWIDDKADVHTHLLSKYYHEDNIVPFKDIDINNPIADIQQMYKSAMAYDYPCDGIVLQVAVTSANNGRVNLDRIALKQADEAQYSATTKVKSIAWRLANDGHYFPHIEFEPVLINGAEVKFAAGYCYDYLKQMNISIGSEVIVTLRGGVIPKVTKVLTSGSGNRNLPKDIAPIEETDIHIWSTNSVEAVQRLKFIRGMSMLALDDCGPSLFEQMYDAGYHTLFDVAEHVKQGVFGIRMLGKVLPDTLASNAKVLTIIDRFKTFNYVWLLLSLRLNNIGFKAADFIGQYISGYELTDYSQLNHKAVQAVLANTELIESVKKYSNKVAPEHATLAKQNVVISNKPKAILSKKPSNGMTKAQFIATYLGDFDITENIREANLLICPNGETSNKINFAKEHNIAIKYYEDYL